ncbi:hypothetical protein F5Y19DRAFT_462118 [Xylariaceae sp. FL1651]|nr:hypothetical protein F5Y19DRAFT_462118 [Xylariaceae sp. FL1651]
MDPLSVTASAIAVTSLAWQSCKAAYELVDGMIEAPEAIAKSRSSLIETQKALDALHKLLETPSERAYVLESISTKRVCDDFTATITRFTSHSTEGRFSKRDRLMISFSDAKIDKCNRNLGDCQRTMSMVVGSINLVITTQTADDIRQLDVRFQNQEEALANLATQFSNRTLSASKEGSNPGEDMSPPLIATLQKVCEETLKVTTAKRTGQSFGDMSTDGQSVAFQGIGGGAQHGVEQSFGKMTTSNNSRAVQGQLDAASLALMFGKRG